MLDIVVSKSTLIEVCDGPVHSYNDLGYPEEYYGKPVDNSYYSDVTGSGRNCENDSESNTNLYLRLRIIRSNIVDGKWKPEEEQEVSVFLREFGCKHVHCYWK